jgi:hypothetical protein
MKKNLYIYINIYCFDPLDIENDCPEDCNDENDVDKYPTNFMETHIQCVYLSLRGSVTSMLLTLSRNYGIFYYKLPPNKKNVLIMKSII